MSCKVYFKKSLDFLLKYNGTRFNSTLYRETSKLQAYQGKRFYLSPAYNCDSKWKERFDDQVIKDIKSMDYYYELIRKYRNEGRVWAIDADIFLNSLKAELVNSMEDEIEEVIRLLRRSPETIKTLPSTRHAVVRLLFEAGKHDLLFKLLTDPMNYGVFLDHYSCAFLMNSYLKDKNFTGASRVASTLMLQEDYGSDLTKALCLMSCVKYILNGDQNEPWVDHHPHEEPEEEVKILVSYVRNQYFDDHFDLKEPSHIVGKTLAWLSMHLEDATLKTNATLLGYASYGKWDKVVKTAEATKNGVVCEDVFSKISEMLSGIENEEVRLRASNAVDILKKNGLLTESKLDEIAEKFVASAVEKFEPTFIKEQESVYDEWSNRRREEVEQQLKEYERRRMAAEIEKKSEDLKSREEVIFFFENQNKFDLILASKIKAEETEDKSKKEDEEYMPPEI